MACWPDASRPGSRGVEMEGITSLARVASTPPRLPTLPWQARSRPSSSAGLSVKRPGTASSSLMPWNRSSWSLNSVAQLVPSLPFAADGVRQLSHGSSLAVTEDDERREEDNATSRHASRRDSFASTYRPRPVTARRLGPPPTAIRPRVSQVWELSSESEIPTGLDTHHASTNSRWSKVLPTEEIHGLAPRSPRSASPLSPSEISGVDGLPTWRVHLFLCNICLAQLFSLAALSQSLAPLHAIARSFQPQVANPGQMAWFTASFSMTLGTFILPAGRLGDMLGHRKIFLVGWMWFAIWSALAGFSYRGGPVMLSVCRGMQGIGPALLVPNGIALIGSTFPIGLQRARAIAAFGGCGPVGMVVGVVSSSLLAEKGWWPWTFWAMGIACLGVAVMTWFVIPPDTARRAPTDDEQREGFDWLGTITGVSGLILINFALNEAPVVGWDMVYIPVLLGAGFLLMAAFVYVELVVARRPIVPLRGLHRDAAFTLVCIMFGWASHGIWSYYLFLLLSVIRGLSPLAVAGQFCPVAPVGFCAAMAVPYLLRKMRVPYLMTLAMIVFTVSILLLLFAPPDQPYYGQTMASIMIAPLAMNWSFPSGTILMSNAVSKNHQGVAASLISTMVNYSIATGLGIAGTVDRYTTPRDGLLGGFHNAWWLGAAFGTAGLFASFYFVWQSRRPMTC